VLLGFLSVFGVGGLVATYVLHAGGAAAALAAVVAGVVGAALAWRLLPVLRESSPSPLSVRDLVGREASVVVPIPAGRFGSVYVRAEGGTHEYSATASADIAEGTRVTVTGALGSGLVVAPIAAVDSAPLL
jgi:membrane protein implicated in regulation of membrane protease activity